MRTLVLAVSIATIGSLTAVGQSKPGGNEDADAIVGVWTGTAVTGRQSADLALEVRRLEKGVGLYMTLPPLHAWRMPLGYLQAASDGTWSLPDWHISLRRNGERLSGQLGDPRVTFELTPAKALPTETPWPAFPTGPKTLWTYDTGAPLWAAPVAWDNVIYAADAKGTVHAVNPTNGAGLWRAALGAPIYGAPLATRDAIFVFDDAGVLRRLQRSTGKESWQRPLGSSNTARALPSATDFAFDFHSPAPVIRDNTLYVSSSAGAVHAIDANTGGVLWRRQLNARVRVTAVVSSRYVVVGTLENTVVALDRGSGEELWRFETAGPVTSAPAIADDVVLVASRDSWITALQADTGTTVWRRYDWLSWIESSGVVVDRVYYLGSSDRRAVRALDPRTGNLLWETDVLGWAWGTPVVTDDMVYIGVAGPQQYVTRHEPGLVALDRKTGRVEWRNPAPSDPTAFVSGYPGSPVLVSRTLVVPNVSGALEAYGLPGPARARQ